MLGLIVRGVVGVATAYSVGEVVTNVVIATTPANLSKAGKVVVVIGGSVLGSIAGTKAYEWVGEQIDDIEEAIADMKENRKVKKELKKMEA